MPQFRPGLHVKTLLGLVVPISLLFMIMSWTNENYLSTKIRANYSENVRLVVNASVEMLRHLSVREVEVDPELVAGLWHRRHPGLVQATVFLPVRGNQFKILIASGRRADAIKPGPVLLEALRSQTWSEVEKDGRLQVTAPFTFKNGARGLFVGVADVGPRDELIESLRLRVLRVLGLGLLALSAIIFVGLENSILGPLHRLRQATMEVDKGGFRPPATISHRDELGDLTRAVSDMTARLDSHAQALERRLSELTVLYNISKVASSSLDLDKTLDIMLESAVKVTEAASGFIMLARPRHDNEVLELELKASLGIPSGEAGTAVISREISDYVARGGGPLLLLGDGTYQEFFRHKDVKDAIYAPIDLGEDTLGVIGLANKQRGSFSKKDLQLLLTLANQASGAINAARLFAELQESYFSTIRALAAAIDAKDPYTRGHSGRVAGYSEMIANHIVSGREEGKAIRIAAYLHDIGKIGVEEQILLKPGSLTEEEYGLIKNHPNISARILTSVSFLKETVPMVAHHHERFDGHGYPTGLCGDEIPLGARIIAVADSFDAMTSDRPYRRALTREQALSEIESQAGSQFDPMVVKIFLEYLDEAPVFSDELV